MIHILPLTDFTLKFPDNSTLKSSFRELTKKQNKDIVSASEEIQKNSNKLTKQIKRLNRKIFLAEKQDNWHEVEKLEIDLDEKIDSLEEYSEKLLDENMFEELFKLKLDASLVGKDKDKILEKADEIGYQYMFGIIANSVAEDRAKN